MQAVRRNRRAWLAGLILVLGAAWVTMLSAPAPAAADETTPRALRDGPRVAGRYTDVSDPAVARALESLAPTQALEAFPGDAFRPSRAVTLGEFARAAAAAFGIPLAAGRPPELGAVEALMERGVLPESPRLYESVDLPVSVANVMGAAVRLAGMRELSESWPAGDPAQAAMALAEASGLAPPSAKPGDASRPATRAEAVQALYAARRISTVKGTLELKGAGTGDITTELGPVRVRFDDASVVVRNGKLAGREALRSGDRVIAAVDLAGRARVVSAQGSGLALGLRGEELVAEAQRVLEEAARQLTPEQWQLLLQGDWQGFAATVTPRVYEELERAGLAPWEVDALAQGDWQAVRSLAADRLSEQAARQLQVAPELVRSVLEMDWETARRLAQQELIERIVNDVIVPNAAGSGSRG